MEVPYSELRKVLCEEDLLQNSLGLLRTVVTDEGKTVPACRVMKLLRLASNLKSRGLTNLSAIEKKELLGNLVFLFEHGHEKWVGRVCHVLYTAKLPPKGSAPLFPGEMIKALLTAVKREKGEGVREILWSLLFKKSLRLEALVNPKDTIPGLWENNAIVRNNVVRFLFNHYTPDQVLDAIWKYSVTSRKTIPGVTLKRCAGLLADQEASKQKRALLKHIIQSSSLEEKEIDRIWAEYLKSLNRFDLVSMMSSFNTESKWLDALKPKTVQLAFTFDQPGSASSCEGFRDRILAVLNPPRGFSARDKPPIEGPKPP